MSFIKEDYLLGNKKVIVGDNLHDLVLETIGKIYIRYGNSYKDFNSIISSLGKTSVSSGIKIVDGNLGDASTYPNGTLIYDAKSDTLYLVYDGKFLTLAEAITENISKYVLKTGDTMSGQLSITCKEAPLKVQSSELVENFNANFLEGHSAKEFAVKAKDENITGNWTFEGKTTFNNNTFFEKTARFDATDGNAAIRVGTGDIITDGSIGSSQYMSGMTGYGWRLDANTNTLEIDNLIVRGILSVFELLVNKISATNGSMWITDSFKVKTLPILEYLPITDSLTVNKIKLLNIEKYYVPYKLQATKVYTESDSFETILDETQALNFYKIQIDADKLSNRNGDNVDIEDEATEFFRFHFLFKINNKEDFLKEVRGEYKTVIEHYEDDEEIVFHYDDLNYLRDADDNYYVLVYNSTTDTYTLEVVDEEDVDSANKVTRTNAEAAIYSRGTDNIDKLCDYEYMTSLAEKGIIEKVNLFQKNVTSMDDYEFSIESLVTDEETGKSTITNINSVKIDPEFDKHYYTIIPANKVSVDTNYGYYCTENVKYKVNLYYKYFGEKFTSVSDFGKTSSLYIVEAEKSEYPVFHPGDILRCQKFYAGNVKQYHAIVLANAGSYGFVIQLQNYNLLTQDMEYHYDEDGNLITDEDSTNSADTKLDTTLYSRDGSILAKLEENSIQEEPVPEEEIIEDKVESYPQKDDALVRIGSISDVDRRNSMLLTSSQSNSPYTDVLVNVNRPDYNVLYFTPKYKRFSKVFTIDGQTIKRDFYIQSDKFGAIINVGKLLFEEEVAWEDIPSDVLDIIEADLTETKYTSTYEEIYLKYKDYVTECVVPDVNIKDTNVVTKPVQVWLTYQENDDSPLYYDEAGNRIKVQKEETYTDDNNVTHTTIVNYYTSSKEGSPIVKILVTNNTGEVTYKDDDETNYVTLTVGKLV